MMALFDRPNARLTGPASTVELTPRERDLLAVFAARPVGALCPPRDIIRALYPGMPDAPTPLFQTAIHGAVCALRKKMDAAGLPSHLLRHRRGHGYVLDIAVRQATGDGAEATAGAVVVG